MGKNNKGKAQINNEEILICACHSTEHQIVIQKDEEDKTYRVNLFFDVLQHILHIELYCDKLSKINPPKIIRYFIQKEMNQKILLYLNM